MFDPLVVQIKNAIIGGQSKGRPDEIRVYMGLSRI